MSQRSWMFLVLCTMIPAGCGDSGPSVVQVHGKVTYRGKPVSLGSINFAPAPESAGGLARPAIGRLVEEGAYHLRAFPNRAGALPGEYLVSVRAYTGSLMERTAKWVVPEKFADSKTSGLKANVPANVAGPIELDFHLSD